MHPCRDGHRPRPLPGQEQRRPAAQDLCAAGDPERDRVATVRSPAPPGTLGGVGADRRPPPALIAARPGARARPPCAPSLPAASVTELPDWKADFPVHAAVPLATKFPMLSPDGACASLLRRRGRGVAPCAPLTRCSLPPAVSRRAPQPWTCSPSSCNTTRHDASRPRTRCNIDTLQRRPCPPRPEVAIAESTAT